MLRGLGNFLARVLFFAAFAYAVWGFDHLLGGDGYDFSAEQVWFLSLLGGGCWDWAADDDGGPFDA